MKSKIFREKSLEKISSPEALNDYIKVANPGVWLIVTSILLILIGFVIVSIVGKVNITSKYIAYSDGSELICYVPEEDISDITGVSTVTINGQDYKMGHVPSMPTALEQGKEVDSYVLHLMDNPSTWVYKVQIEATLPEGAYTCSAVTATVSPITFIMN